MSVCMCICMYVRAYVRMKYVCICIYMYIYIYIHIYIYIYNKACTHTRGMVCVSFDGEGRARGAANALGHNDAQGPHQVSTCEECVFRQFLCLLELFDQLYVCMCVCMCVCVCMSVCVCVHMSMHVVVYFLCMDKERVCRKHTS
jgi:hypothetical protein